MKAQLYRGNRYFLVVSFILMIGSTMLGQKDITSGPPVFITNDNASKNTIYIPNKENFYQFKIYKKTQEASHYDFVATINQSSSQKNSALPHSLIWIDETPNAQRIYYTIEAYNRNGTKICDMKVIWQAVK